MTILTKHSSGEPVDCDACRTHVNGLCLNDGRCMLRAVTGRSSCGRHLDAGHDLFRLGERCDSIYTLIDGWMFRYTLLADGRRQILDFVLPGGVLASRAAHDDVMMYSAQALTDAVVCAIPHKALGPLSRQDPEIGLRLAYSICEERNLSFAHLTSIGRHSARERVAHLILELFVRHHAQWPGHRVQEMYLPLTQEHIGDATGLTGVHVNRVLSDLRKDGILKFSYRRLSIHDPDRLVDVAGIDPVLMESWIRPDGNIDGWDSGRRHAAA